ncbi:transmembrane protein 154 isoform X4 [Oryzias latipes]|uniref:transmembrane protein 154 isoform X4 n=1 Tax=Oryzias latipes TaxID=8090 RepID=UPI0005CC34F6|nr:transmembrane protein 154 isoform X4 [Oryzias latipes]
MRDAWVNTPLLLLLLLLASLTRTAISQDNEGAENTEDTENTENDENVEKAEEVSDLASDNTQDDSQPDNTEEEPNTTQENGGDLATQSETEITTESTAVQDDASTRSPTTLDEASSSATEGSAEDPLSEEAPVTYDLDYVSSDSSTEEPGDSTLMLILIPVVIVTLICMVVCGYFIIRKWKQNATKRASVKEDPFLDEPSTEKVPMPMFEEDVPSVLELEMEDFDQWITKDC